MLTRKKEKKHADEKEGKQLVHFRVLGQTIRVMGE
jgi:hypothetical protein